MAGRLLTPGSLRARRNLRARARARGRGIATAPELDQFIVAAVQLTGRVLGAGAYGTVEEAEIPGATVAAKQLHQQLVNLGSPQQVEIWVTDFVEECMLMSQLRHPHIVQFLGVCYLPGSQLPVLLMEKLQTSLDSLLETSPNIPIDLKVHLLVGTGRGLVYLHSRTPPIAHCSLSARDILVDNDLNAKIAGMGTSKIVNLQPGELTALMPSIPGPPVYMPPEAMPQHECEDTRYNTAIDIFSFGVVSLFTLTQRFPKNLKPAMYQDPATRSLIARSEIERREDYIVPMKARFGETHPLVQLTLDCLEFHSEDRPSAVVVLRRLEEVGTTLPQNCTQTKLELVQQVAENEEEIRRVAAEKLGAERVANEKQAQIDQLQQRMSVQISQLQEANDSLQAEKREQVCGLEEKTQQVAERAQINWLQRQMFKKHAQISQFQEANDRLQSENRGLINRLQSAVRSTVVEKQEQVCGLEATFQLEQLEIQRREINRLSASVGPLLTQSWQFLPRGLEKREALLPLLMVAKCTKEEAEIVLQLLDEVEGELAVEWWKYPLQYYIEAVKDHRAKAKEFLIKECEICMMNYLVHDFVAMPGCVHSICEDCFKGHFTVVITGQEVKHFTCPICGEPDMANKDITAGFYLQMFLQMVKKHLSAECFKLCDNKLKEFSLSNDPNFVWCANTECRSGFIHEGRAIDVACPYCRKSMCRNCKKKWEPAHEGISCEVFAKWKIDNDPNAQELGLAAHLQANGIECPRCHFKYDLARGGCMHFKCVKCPNEFCSGCCQSFKQGLECGKLESCNTKGLHAHHPRDCLFYMRDFDVAELQAFLTQCNIPYDITVKGAPKAAASDEVKPCVCKVMLQKETMEGLIDEECGRDVVDGHARLCLTHYKEYLVDLINRNKLDPISMYTTVKIELMLTRDEMPLPGQDNLYDKDVQRDKLIQHVKQHLPLPNAQGLRPVDH